jgi:hypothetical protein
VRLSRTLAVIGAGLGTFVLARCSFSVDPDEGHFSCISVADCASGQRCVPQPDGGNGLCYAIGECAPVTAPCGPGQACVDAGCIDCTSCAETACAAASCVTDGGAEVCLLRLVLADGGLADAGADAGVRAGRRHHLRLRLSLREAGALPVDVRV